MTLNRYSMSRESYPFSGQLYYCYILYNLQIHKPKTFKWPLKVTQVHTQSYQLHSGHGVIISNACMSFCRTVFNMPKFGFAWMICQSPWTFSIRVDTDTIVKITVHIHNFLLVNKCVFPNYVPCISQYTGWRGIYAVSQKTITFLFFK